MRSAPAKASNASDESNGRRKRRFMRSKLYVKMILLRDTVTGTQEFCYHLFQYFWLQGRGCVGQDVNGLAL